MQCDIRKRACPRAAHARLSGSPSCMSNLQNRGRFPRTHWAPVKHEQTYSCASCRRSFRSQQALEQHEQDSPAHATQHDCQSCARSFGSREALEQHLQTSLAHNTPVDSSLGSPLDRFFLSFVSFPYDPFSPPASSYALLRKHKKWNNDNPKEHAAWQMYQEALSEELDLLFGPTHDLVAWHALCRAVNIDPLPDTCGGCKKVFNRSTACRLHRIH